MRLFIFLLFLPTILIGQSPIMRDDSPMYTEFVDKNFPFLEATVDFRGIAPAGNTDNLVPRGLVIPLAEDVFICFDTELLRVAGIWQGDFTTMEGLALLSYEVPLRKKGGGQTKLPKPKGNVFAATDLYPGWHKQAQDNYVDPRSRGSDEQELGRGPLPPEYGEWLGTEDKGDSAILNYTLFGGTVREQFRLDKLNGESVVVRSIQLNGITETINLVANDKGVETANRFDIRTFDCGPASCTKAVVYPLTGTIPKTHALKPFNFSRSKKSQKQWPNSIVTEMKLGEPQGSYAVDELRFPYPNPWQRRIRPYGIEFYPNGDAAVVTYDGDVYRITNLGTNDSAVSWTKIAAGFNEPCSIRLRGDDLFVFSRLGVTQLVDKDGDGETDFYKMFCNRFTQSAETRDFAHSLTLWDDDTWIISKGGQQNDFLTPHSGRVMQISAAGKEVDYWAYGFRNGYVNSIPEKGLLVASDQQGNWVPSTPFHVVRKGSFHGYEPGGPSEKTEVQPAALWFPHRVAQSGIDPVWGSDARLGALYKSILYINFQKPSLIKILIPEEGKLIQTAGIPLDIDFEVPLLKGAINPIDGMAYMVGFQIWDSFAKRLEGLCRLRVVKQTDRYPTRAEVFREGVLLHFSEQLDPKVANDPANYAATSWEYLRQEEYGSAQYKADGTPGADIRFVHSVLLSKTRKSVFLAIDKMTTTMQLEVQHHLFGEWKQVYFTINELKPSSLIKLGFESTNFQKLFASVPTPRDTTTKQAIVSEARGQELATLYGCVGCHSIDGTTDGKSGPTWKGLWEAGRTLADGRKVRATEEYLTESIFEPSKVSQPGYQDLEAGMPSYKGILSDEDVQSVILYIRSLHK